VVLSSMARAKRNPRGFHPSPRDLESKAVEIVRVGKDGGFTHIWNPYTQLHLCMSGVGTWNANEVIPDIYTAPYAKTVTCYRCAKLATMNMQDHGSPLPSSEEEA
jgi:hypothetical protein